MPAAGMQILLEQDATRIGIVTENHEHAWADVGRHVLKFASECYVTDRLLKVTGQGLDYTVKSFKGADLRNNHDVFVIRGSTIPNSKVYERQEILNTYQAGLLGDPMDPKLRQKVLGMLQYGDVGEMWQDFSIDMNQINRDIDMIKKDEIPLVHEMDNHALHIQEKNRLRKSDKFTAMPPNQQAVLESNIEEHLQWDMKLKNPGLDQKVDMAETMVDEAQKISPEEIQMKADIPAPEPTPEGVPV